MKRRKCDVIINALARLSENPNQMDSRHRSICWYEALPDICFTVPEDDLGSTIWMSKITPRDHVQYRGEQQNAVPTVEFGNPQEATLK